MSEIFYSYAGFKSSDNSPGETYLIPEAIKNWDFNQLVAEQKKQYWAIDQMLLTQESKYQHEPAYQGIPNVQLTRRFLDWLSDLILIIQGKKPGDIVSNATYGWITFDPSKTLALLLNDLKIQAATPYVPFESVAAREAELPIPKLPVGEVEANLRAALTEVFEDYKDYSPYRQYQFIGKTRLGENTISDALALESISWPRNQTKDDWLKFLALKPTLESESADVTMAEWIMASVRQDSDNFQVYPGGGTAESYYDLATQGRFSQWRPVTRKAWYQVVNATLDEAGIEKTAQNIGELVFWVYDEGFIDAGFAERVHYFARKYSRTRKRQRLQKVLLGIGAIAAAVVLVFVALPALISAIGPAGIGSVIDGTKDLAELAEDAKKLKEEGDALRNVTQQPGIPGPGISGGLSLQSLLTGSPLIVIGVAAVVIILITLIIVL